MAKRKNSMIAATAYFVFFLPLILQKRKNEFLSYHVNQGAWLFFVALALQGLLSLWAGWGFPFWIALRVFIRVFLLVMVTSGVLTAMRGEEKKLPVIGKFAPNFF